MYSKTVKNFRPKVNICLVILLKQWCTQEIENCRAFVQGAWCIEGWPKVSGGLFRESLLWFVILTLNLRMRSYKCIKSYCSVSSACLEPTLFNNNKIGKNYSKVPLRYLFVFIGSDHEPGILFGQPLFLPAVLPVTKADLRCFLGLCNCYQDCQLLSGHFHRLLPRLLAIIQTVSRAATQSASYYLDFITGCFLGCQLLSSLCHRLLPRLSYYLDCITGCYLGSQLLACVTGCQLLSGPDHRLLSRLLATIQIASLAAIQAVQLLSRLHQRLLSRLQANIWTATWVRLSCYLCKMKLLPGLELAAT